MATSWKLAVPLSSAAMRIACNASRLERSRAASCAISDRTLPGTSRSLIDLDFRVKGALDLGEQEVVLRPVEGFRGAAVVVFVFPQRSYRLMAREIHRQPAHLRRLTAP